MEKPPYSATPLGQPLSPNVPRSDRVNATPTANSKAGGYPGYTRSGGDKFHAGLDDPSGRSSATAVATYQGTQPGKVIEAREAYNEKGESLGKMVVIRTETPNGTYESKTLHHNEVFVKKGDTLRPGEPYARGTGYGDQAKSREAGDPHVHWEVRRSGVLVQPGSGEPVIKRN